jgi:hypothetical protein
MVGNVRGPQEQKAQAGKVISQRAPAFPVASIMRQAVFSPPVSLRKELASFPGR